MNINQAIETAKAKAAGNAKWTRAIERAAAGLQSNDICVTLFCNGYALVTTPTGQHMVNGACDCTAAKHGHKECVHRVAKRLTEMMDAPEASFVADVAESSRAHLLVEIRNIWSRTQTTPLAVELMARFRVNQLEMLDDDMLRRVRLAIAV
jgi:hypothetical protein